MVAHAYNPSTLEVEAEDQKFGHPWLCKKLKINLGYMIFCLKKNSQLDHFELFEMKQIQCK